MSHSSLLMHALWLGIEDFSGLWEVEWELNVRHEAGRGGVNRVAALGLVFELYERGWVELFRCQEPYGALDVVPRDEVRGLLVSAASWEEPTAHGVSVRFGTTEAGTTAYLELERAEPE